MFVSIGLPRCVRALSLHYVMTSVCSVKSQALPWAWLVNRFGRHICLILGSTISVIILFGLCFSNKTSDKELRRIIILISKVVQGFGLGTAKVATVTVIKQFPWSAWITGVVCSVIIIAYGLSCSPSSAYAIFGERSSLRLQSKSMSSNSLRMRSTWE